MNSAEVNLKVKFRDVLTGFEKYNFTEAQIKEQESDFETALTDFKTCKACDGEVCMTTFKHHCKNPEWHQVLKCEPCGPDCYPGKGRVYFGLFHRGCKEERRPSFAVHVCQEPEERKRQILVAVTSKHQEAWWDRD